MITNMYLCAAAAIRPGHRPDYSPLPGTRPRCWRTTRTHHCDGTGVRPSAAPWSGTGFGQQGRSSAGAQSSRRHRDPTHTRLCAPKESLFHFFFFSLSTTFNLFYQI